MNYNLKIYFNKINYFFLFLVCILAAINFFLDLSSTYIYIFCFLLIATVGVSHGAYDGNAGEILFLNKYKNWKFIFYFAYIALAILVFVIWYLNPLISLIIFLTEMTSNVATTSTFLPVIGALAIAIGAIPVSLTIPVCLAASCAFMLPVATPPNAIVYGSGKFTIATMMKAGLALNIIGIFVVSLFSYYLAPILF